VKKIPALKDGASLAIEHGYIPKKGESFSLLGAKLEDEHHFELASKGVGRVSKR